MKMGLVRVGCRLMLAAGISVGGVAGLGSALGAEKGGGKEIPVTRVEMKNALEALKKRTPRLPLPPVTQEELKNAGGRIVVNNGRMRRLYLPESWYSSDFRKDEKMTVDDRFKVHLFWIVSRGNNCHYCLGHQEHKLLVAGDSEDVIASLDGDWSEFPEKERMVMELTRRVTLMPGNVQREEFEGLKKFYSESEIVEIVYAISMFNSVNRWTDSLGIPQDEQFGGKPLHLDTPTSEKRAQVKSWMSKVSLSKASGWRTRSEVEAGIRGSAEREPIVKLATDEQVPAAMAELGINAPYPQWVRAVCIFPQTGMNYAKSIHGVVTEGRLPGQIKAKLAWVAACENRAGYAAALTLKWMRGVGVTEEEAYAALNGEGEAPEKEILAVEFGRKLTATPQGIGDQDIVELRKHFTDHEVAEIVYVTCMSNSFDRLTESLQLSARGEE